MATSNNTIWQLTRDEIINAALRKISVVGEGQSANTTQLSEGAQALNAIITEFATLGMPLWKREELGITLVPGQKEYEIGIGETINHPFPLKLYQANLALTGSSTRLNMQILAHYDYNNLPVSTSGTPVQVTYQPMNNVGVLSVWPEPSTSVPTGSQIILTFQRPFDVFTSGTETLDFPQEWAHALIYQLAHVLSDEYALPLEDRRWYEKQAEKRLSTALAIGTEDGSLFFYPDRGI